MIRGDRRGSRQAKIKSAKRRADVIGRYLKGERVEDIADDLAIPKRTAWNDISTLLEEYKHHAAKDAEAHVGEELAKLAKIEIEAWEQWEKSKTKGKESAVNKTTVKVGRSAKTITERETEKFIDRVGDPRFLQILLSCHEKRAQMLGLREHMATPQVEEFMRRIGDAMREMVRIEEDEIRADEEVSFGGEVIH